MIGFCISNHSVAKNFQDLGYNEDCWFHCTYTVVNRAMLDCIAATRYAFFDVRCLIVSVICY